MKRVGWIILSVMASCGVLRGAPFTPGDLVIYRVGDGSSSLVNTGNPVFLDEYTPTGVLVQSIALPSTGPNALIASGTAGTEGMLNFSPDGQFLAVTGYNTTTGGSTSLANTAAATVNRIVDILDLNGNILSSTKLSDFADANNPRTAITTNGTDIWVGGGAGGVRYTTAGSTTSTPLNTTYTNIRDVQIAGGQLYVATQTGSAPFRVGSVGSGTPTTGGQTIANLPGLTTTGLNPETFVFADLSAGVTGFDTLYVADATANLIKKFSLVSGNWMASGSVAASAVRGLSLSLDGGNLDLFGTSNGASNTSGILYKFVDNTGYNGTISGNASTLATLGANETFRGIATVVPEPSTVSLLFGGVLLAAAQYLRRRRY